MLRAAAVLTTCATLGLAMSLAIVTTIARTSHPGHASGSAAIERAILVGSPGVAAVFAQRPTQQNGVMSACPYLRSQARTTCPYLQQRLDAMGAGTTCPSLRSPRVNDHPATARPTPVCPYAGDRREIVEPLPTRTLRAAVDEGPRPLELS